MLRSSSFASFGALDVFLRDISPLKQWGDLQSGAMALTWVTTPKYLRHEATLFGDILNRDLVGSEADKNNSSFMSVSFTYQT